MVAPQNVAQESQNVHALLGGPAKTGGHTIVMWGAKICVGLKREPSPPDVMNRSNILLLTAARSGERTTTLKTAPAQATIVGQTHMHDTEEIIASMWHKVTNWHNMAYTETLHQSWSRVVFHDACKGCKAGKCAPVFKAPLIGSVSFPRQSTQNCAACRHARLSSPHARLLQSCTDQLSALKAARQRASMHGYT